MTGLGVRTLKRTMVGLGHLVRSLNWIVFGWIDQDKAMLVLLNIRTDITQCFDIFLHCLPYVCYVILAYVLSSQKSLTSTPVTSFIDGPLSATQSFCAVSFIFPGVQYANNWPPVIQ